MPDLVAYAGKRGARLIAGRIALSLAAAERQAEAPPVRAAGALAGYGAFVTGSAADGSRRQPRSSPGGRLPRLAQDRGPGMRHRAS